MARRLNFSSINAYAKIERGESTASLKNFEKILEANKVPIKQIIG